MTKVAVIGNTARNLGAACAADIALGGHEVRYCPLSNEPDVLDALRADGGFIVQGDASAFFSRRTGKATLQAVCDDPRDALQGAQVVVLDIPMQQLEQQFEQLIPALAPHAVVYVQSFGYWAAARLTPLLRSHGRDDVLVCEAAVPTHSAALTGTLITAKLLRQGIEVATIPGNRVDEALAALHPVFPDLIAAPSVLQTSLESMNLMVHPAMVLLSVGIMERAERQEEKVAFYRDCNLPSASLLAEAMDRERSKVCAAYGVRHRSLPSAIGHYYGADGDTVQEAVLQCEFYQNVRPGSPTTWRGWEAVDVPYAIAPLVLLAEQAGVSVPLHRSLAEILGTLLGFDPWIVGPSLVAMDLIGEPSDVVQRYQ